MSADPREAAALAAVIQHPDDDDARLAYADVIAHHDAERAELIHAQVVLARGRRTQTKPDRWNEHYTREQGLLNRRGAAWAAAAGLGDLITAYKFRRGFLEEVTVDAATFLARAADLYARAPVLHLTLTGARGHTAALFASPALARLHSLSLYKNEVGDAGAEHLAGSPYVRGLHWLELSHNGITQTGLDAIAASPNLPALAYLGFRGNAVDDPGPRIGGQDEYGLVHDMEYPDAGKELMRRFGPKTWLTTPVRSDWPPARDAV
jgi:uncharacterized protein (TIGR02996 family)